MTTLLLPIARLPGTERRPEPDPVERGQPWARLGAVPAAIGLALMPSWWSAAEWSHAGPLGALSLVPLLALLVGWSRLRVPPRGPQIHDRQLDLILCVAAAVCAVALLAIVPRHPGGPHAAVAACLVAVSITTAGWGSRALWQVRWAVGLLSSTWPAPWAAAVDALEPGITASALGFARTVSPGASTSMIGEAHVLRVPHAYGVSTVDAAAGGGLLLLPILGVLGGVAWALCTSGIVRRAGALLVGVVSGAVLSLGRWGVVVASARSGAVDGSSITVFHVAPGVLGLVLAATGVQLLRRRRRHGAPAPGAGGLRLAASRLEVAVPRARLSTSVVLVLGVMFALLVAGAVQPAVPPHSTPAAARPTDGPL